MGTKHPKTVRVKKCGRRHVVLYQTHEINPIVQEHLLFRPNHKASKDTVSIGVTFTNKQAFKVDSIAIINGDTVIGKKVEHLFTEQVKNKWDCRFFIYLTRKELKKLRIETPPTLSFFGMGNSNIQLQIKPSDWEKIVQINDAIYNQIKLNEK